MFKVYATREETRRMSHDMPIGDPFGGPAYGERNDPITAGVSGGTAILGGILGGNASKKAAKSQEEAANQTNALNRYMYDTTRADYQPFRDAGYSGLNRLLALQGMGQVGDGKYQYAGDANSLLQLDPGYQFRQQQQQQALERSAAARGGLLSGRQMKDTMKYGGDLASQEYGNVWNRLANLAGVGQSATGSTASAGQNYAGNAGNAMMQAGNARASGYMGQANAYSNALGNIGNNYMAYKMFGGGA